LPEPNLKKEDIFLILKNCIKDIKISNKKIKFIFS